MKRVLKERSRKDQVVPTRRSTGPLDMIDGRETYVARSGMHRFVRPPQVSSGPLPVIRQVSSGTGQHRTNHLTTTGRTPEHRQTSGKAQVNRQVSSGTGQHRTNHLTTTGRTPEHRQTSGKAQVNRQVSSGTGQHRIRYWNKPDGKILAVHKTTDTSVKHQKRPKKTGKGPKRGYKKSQKFLDYHRRRRKRLAEQVAKKNTPEARAIRKKKKLTGYQELLKSKLEKEKRKKRLLVAKLRFCQTYARDLKIPSEENWRGKLREDLIPEYLRGKKNTGMWV